MTNSKIQMPNEDIAKIQQLKQDVIIYWLLGNRLTA